MGAFNVVIKSIECRACRRRVQGRIQFKYGDVWQHEYQVGDTIRWGGNDVGKPHEKNVVADGVAEDCPHCHDDAEQSFFVFIRDNVIRDVVPSDGRYDFVAINETYLVLDA